MFREIFLICLLFSTFAFAGAREKWLFLGDSITFQGIYVDYIETWYLRNEENAPEMIDLGVSSETISGLSEAAHPFPRPHLLARLEKVLEGVQPTRVIACYGMNCGIYHPFSVERFEAYKEGINRLITATRESGADLILLTPPPYAVGVAPRRGPVEGEEFSWEAPTSDYNEVLARYAEWILTLDGLPGVRAIDIRPGLEAHMEKSYKTDPIHPIGFGHAVIAEGFLRGLGKETGSDLLQTGIDRRGTDSNWSALIKCVGQQRMSYDRALLNDIGHGNPSIMATETNLAEAERGLKVSNAEIEKILAEL